ncbi:hypothetical protein TWF481_003494 [Arthrobotrys musiformis]|uniref:Uncharacterized protein n=1 Tax=Arthrobotrys musiformis TaxID=47236 RepID=A0AAV9VQG5_9PEZI
MADTFRPLPSSVTVTMSDPSSTKRRRSTTSVFAGSNHPTKDHQTPVRSKVPPQEPDTALSREVQQDALELTGQTDDTEAQEQAELAEILSQGDWAESEVALFRRLRRRGREPLLPTPWRLDFTTFPEALYAPVGEQSFICALTPSASMEFRGSQALQRLVNVGGQVRDRTEINPSAPVEPLIFQEIKNFLTWAEKDGEISLFCILTINYNRSKNGNSKTTSEKTERKMKLMADELRAKRQRSPHPIVTSSNSIESTDTPTRRLNVVYGITVYNCVAALSSLSCDNPDADVKTHVVLDWTDVGLDIWNAIAVAIFIVSCRNDILDSDEGARLKLVPQADDDA